MRSVLAGVMCVALGACAIPVEPGSTDDAAGDIVAPPAEPIIDGSLGESAECQSSPFGQRENLCYEIYLTECAVCKLRHPPREPPACYAAAMERLAACLKRCKE